MSNNLHEENQLLPPLEVYHIQPLFLHGYIREICDILQLWCVQFLSFQDSVFNVQLAHTYVMCSVFRCASISRNHSGKSVSQPQFRHWRPKSQYQRIFEVSSLLYLQLRILQATDTAQVYLQFSLYSSLTCCHSCTPLLSAAYSGPSWTRILLFSCRVICMSKI